jgi:predicted DsbA family dithiol-disulfide isomerase
MASETTLTIDFFHDVVCCWCFNISSRMRRLESEFNLDVRHRTFVLQASPAEMRARWGSPDQARNTILEHWESCRAVSDEPELINVDAMRLAEFDYPHGYTAALACKATELLAGQHAHWDLFDHIQRAHLSDACDIADHNTIAKLLQKTRLNSEQVVEKMNHPEVPRAVEADRLHARALQVQTIPALVVRETGTRLVNGPLDDLRAQIHAAIRLNAN